MYPLQRHCRSPTNKEIDMIRFILNIVSVVDAKIERMFFIIFLIVSLIIIYYTITSSIELDAKMFIIK